MIVELWANEIIARRRTYNQVPFKLKEAVKNKLIEKGHEELVIE